MYPQLHELDQQELAAKFADPGLVLAIGPFALKLQLVYKELIPAALELYAYHHLIEEERVIDFDVIVKPIGGVRKVIMPRIGFYRNGKKWLHHFPAQIAWPMLCWAINHELLLLPNQHLILHSATLAKGDRAVLIPGASGAGKSTLCAALMLEGWRLLSDEAGLIKHGESVVWPVPLPVSLKNESIEVIKQFSPDAFMSDVAHGTSKGSVAHVRPTPESMALYDQPAEVSLVIEPKYQAGAALHCEPTNKADAMIRTAFEGINYRLSGEAGFDCLTRVFDKADTYQLTYSNLHEAVACINQLEAGNWQAGGEA